MGRYEVGKEGDMEPIGTFPFGQPVQKVVQTDRRPKSVLVLGVYASAVHARWVRQKRNTRFCLCATPGRARNWASRPRSGTRCTRSGV